MKRSPSSIQVLVVDDEVNIRKSLELMLETEGYRVMLAQDATKGYDLITRETFDLVILDIQMPEVSGLQLFERMKREGMNVPAIVISGNATLTEAARAVQMGAFDFIEKPFLSDRVLLTVKHCLEQTELKTELNGLIQVSANRTYVGSSPAIKNILSTVAKVAPSEAAVFIHGESGTGKELIAQMIHDQSPRKNRPFIKVNCSAIPENLIESELFGHERGAFTGATTSRRGYFEQADGGTLFLDEIGDMPLAAQAKLLRTIQSSEVQKVGSEKILKVNVRVVAATHKDLEVEIQEKRFREDLYFRLHVVPIHTIALREHSSDIPELTLKFVKECCERNGFKEKKVETDVFSKLKKYTWPGNVRELHNLVERIVILSGETITVEDLPAYLGETKDKADKYSGLSLKDFKEQSERDYLVALLQQCQGNISKAAKILGIERTHLHKKIQRFQISKREFFS